jgi:hypothetical protein
MFKQGAIQGLCERGRGLSQAASGQVDQIAFNRSIRYLGGQTKGNAKTQQES